MATHSGARCSISTSIALPSRSADGVGAGVRRQHSFRLLQPQDLPVREHRIHRLQSAVICGRYSAQAVFRRATHGADLRATSSLSSCSCTRAAASAAGWACCCSLSLAAVGLISRGRLTLFFAALATLPCWLEHTYQVLYPYAPTSQFAQAGLLGVGFFATGWLAHSLAKRAVAIEAHRGTARGRSRQHGAGEPAGDPGHAGRRTGRGRGWRHSTDQRAVPKPYWDRCARHARGDA